MLSLTLNFLKRAVFVPLLLSAAFIAALWVMPPIQADDGNNTVLSKVDISQYTARQYNRFEELERDDYAGALFSRDFAFGEVPVLYNVEHANTASLAKGSGEPWNGGSMLVTGKNADNQFKKLHAAQKGDTVVFEPYSQNGFTFTITQIQHGVREAELKKYLKKGSLVLAYPYNDFSNLGNAVYYTVIVAQ